MCGESQAAHTKCSSFPEKQFDRQEMRRNKCDLFKGERLDQNDQCR